MPVMSFYSDRLRRYTEVSEDTPLPVVLGSTGTPVVGLMPTLRNSAGQVKANYTGLTLTNFGVQVNQTFNIAGATVTLSLVPTTTWPLGGGSTYNPDFFDTANTRLRENPVMGQAHTWRIDGTFANKANGNNGALIIEIYNPDSGFTNTGVITLASGITSGSWTVNLMSIADGASIPAGKGYRVRCRTSFADANLLININNITRISHAVENVVIV